MWLWHLGPDYMANFSLLSCAEISARFLKEILMKWNWRLHGEGFSRGCNSALAENPSPVWKTGLGFSSLVSLRAYFLSMQVHISGWEICSQRQFRFSSIITIVGYYYPKKFKIECQQKVNYKRSNVPIFTICVLGTILTLLRLFAHNFILGAKANISARAEICHVIRSLNRFSRENIPGQLVITCI